ncbi:hypothetical protein EDD11_006952 [Mortierella claussenii]|nr:hypothetical protein EDD11_006952 [Mortierella claussenii]
MLSVYSPLQIETTSSFPFHSEMRSSLASHSHNQHSHHDRDQAKSAQDQIPSRPSSAADWKSPSHSSSTHTLLNSKSSTTSTETASTETYSHYSNRSSAEYSGAKIGKASLPPSTEVGSLDSWTSAIVSNTFSFPMDVLFLGFVEAMTPQSSQPIYSTPFYPSTEYGAMKAITPQFNSSHYLSPYSSHNRLTIHDRRQSLMASRGKASNTPPPSNEARSRPDYSSQGQVPLPEDVMPATQQSSATWDSVQSSTQSSSIQPVQDSHPRSIDSYSTVQPSLPPLSEALHGLSSASSPSLAVSSPMQSQQAALSTMGNMVASPPNFYAPNPYLEMQAPVNIYPTQDQYESDPTKMANVGVSDRHPGMVPHESSAVSNAGYGRRGVTYPFVSSLESGTGLVMSNVMPSDPAVSSALSSNPPFAHNGLVGASSVAVQGMPRATPTVDYVNSLALQQQVHAQAPPTHHHIPGAQGQPGMHSIAWSQNGDMSSVDGSVNGSKTYSFVPLSGVNSKKRPRRRFDEIERLYVCNWGDCEKAYGTLNHLNAHVNMQKHGPKRLPAGMLMESIYRLS